MGSGGVREETLVVILAAGKGTRMGNDDLVKVCFEIDGVPAINRQINVFKSARINRFLLVVGDRAEQVLSTVVPEHPEVMYVQQEPQLGRGTPLAWRLMRCRRSVTPAVCWFLRATS